MASIRKRWYTGGEPITRFEKILLMLQLNDKDELRDLVKGDKELENMEKRIEELSYDEDIIGLYDKEVYDYVTREIVLLTIIGILIGLIFGFFLNSFILKTCEIEMLRFKRIITWQSYLISSLITIVFTYIVNFITFFSLKKIDMIESLKSVE